jgi:endonuclease III
MDKVPFDIDLAVSRIREAIKPYPKAALFELYEDGYTSLFEQLLACIISIRTYDEVTVKLARNLFVKARTPQAVLSLTVEEIDRLISTSTFHDRKAAQIRQIAATVIETYAGELPCDADVLMSFSGVGIKCANLALGIACGQPRISVDVHVHRVTNRWGYLRTNTPEKTVDALMTKLPEKYWIEINRLLVPFGKHICTGALPRCSTCPVLEMCKQVGVDRHR